MKLHNLKIKEEYATAKLYGNKMFEIRKNDRDFKAGDIVRYSVVYPNGKKPSLIYHAIEDKLFVITYITDFEQKNGFVVFGEKEVEK